MSRLFDEDTPAWVRWTLAGVAVVLATVVLAFLYLLDPFSSQEVSPAPPAAGRSKESSVAPSSSVCGLPDGNQVFPAKAPDATWSKVGELAMPSNPTYGPGEPSAIDRSCFAHSPLGAVFAAMNPPESSRPNDEGLQYAGFRIDDYTPERTTIDLAFRITQGKNAGALFSGPATLVWNDGDWNGAPADVQPVILRSLAGYIAFGPGGA